MMSHLLKKDNLSILGYIIFLNTKNIEITLVYYKFITSKPFLMNNSKHMGLWEYRCYQ